MKSTQIILSFTIAASIGVMTLGGASAAPRLRRDRDRDAEAAAAATAKANNTNNSSGDTVHETNQNTREQRRSDASPNEKATAFNVANSKHDKKETQKEDVTTAATDKASSDQGLGRRRRR